MSTRTFCDGCGKEIPEHAPQHRVKVEAGMMRGYAESEIYADLHPSASCLAAWALRIRFDTLPTPTLHADAAIVSDYRKQIEKLLGCLTSDYGRKIP